MRATKRKLDDAFQTLDDAVGTSERLDGPPPLKKSATSRSLYSTLAKYGIKAKEPNVSETDAVLSNKTPHLAAILSRVATKKRKALSNFTPPSSLSEAEYRPSSIPSFLSRLSTYKLATYANKPAAINAVAAAKCGWVNDGKDRLICNICSVSWVVAGKEGMTRDAAHALIERQRASLVDMHKNGCPWKTRQCEDTIYRIPLQSPSTTIKLIKENALQLDSVLQDVEIRHPLTANQLSQFKNAVLSFVLLDSEEQPSETAMLTSLFGWSLAPERPRPTRQSSSSVPSTPAFSRASSVTPGEITPFSPAILDRVMSRDNTLVHCILCQRRVGLWGFAPSDSARPPTGRRQFDLLQEHRSYCPFVVKSTVVPSVSLPPMPNDAQEGWKAVLTVVQRYGLGQRLGRNEDDRIEVDGVEAMVEGVKSHGGRDLLKYIKGLLG